MGLLKWVMRNGPSSPGKTARVLFKMYKSTFTSSSKFDKYEAVYRERINILVRLQINHYALQSYNKFEDRIYAVIAEDDMPLFVFAIYCIELGTSKESINSTNFDIILDVIREEITKLDYSLITLTEKDYKNKAVIFFNAVN